MSLLQQAPRFDADAAASLARDLFGIDGVPSPLPSERDQNFLLTSADGARFILKIANATETRELLEAQNAAMAHVEDVGICPRVHATPGGESIVRLPSGHFVRLLSWIHGIPLGTIEVRPDSLLEDLGDKLGQLSGALATFDHPAIHRDFYWDIAGGFDIVNAHAPLIEDAALRGFVLRTAAHIHARDGRRLSRVRRSVVHGDANDFNVIVDPSEGHDPRVTGLIDFGDMVHSYTVAEPAIAIAYAVLDHQDPLRAASAIVRGYHRAHPLTSDEVSVLFGLVQLRLCMSICIAAHQQKQRPDDEYLSISQAPIHRTLPVLSAIHPDVAEEAFAGACGINARPEGRAYESSVNARPEGRAYESSVNARPEGRAYESSANARPEGRAYESSANARPEGRAYESHGDAPPPTWASGSPLVGPTFRSGVPPVDVTLRERRERLGGNLSIAYADPIKITRGWMQYLFDDRGVRYLDAYNNVPHVGHSHPRVVEATHEQLRTLNTNTRYLHDTIWRFAERLTATLPDPLRVCYFVNSGSEANELALRLARAHTGARDVIVLESAYHGNTTTLIDISPYKFNGPGGGGAPDWVHVAPIPDDYRGIKERSKDEGRRSKGNATQRGSWEAGRQFGDEVGAIVDDLRRSNRRLAAFICETCPSVGGQIIPPNGYLETVYLHVRATGGVCIADEVQTAYGRLGDSFYGFEAQGVTPDIVVLGKPIGNGYPLGAVVTTREIARSFDNGMEFFSTFGGSTVSCAAGLATLETTLDEDLQAHAQRVGARMLEGLRALAARHAMIGDVRGRGLFLGVELVRDRETLEPATREASIIVNRMRERRILLGTEGPFHNVLKIRPPMPFTEQDADHLVRTLDEVLADM